MKEQAFGQGITMLLQLGSPAELEKLEMTDHSTGKTFLENCSAAMLIRQCFCAWANTKEAIVILPRHYHYTAKFSTVPLVVTTVIRPLQSASPPSFATTSEIAAIGPPTGEGVQCPAMRALTISSG